jgi:hypothetical protein
MPDLQAQCDNARKKYKAITIVSDIYSPQIRGLYVGKYSPPGGGYQLMSFGGKNMKRRREKGGKCKRKRKKGESKRKRKGKKMRKGK